MTSPLKRRKRKPRSGSVPTDMELGSLGTQKRQREAEFDMFEQSPKKLKSEIFTIRASMQDKAAAAEDQPRCEQ